MCVILCVFFPIQVLKIFRHLELGLMSRWTVNMPMYVPKHRFPSVPRTHRRIRTNRKPYYGIYIVLWKLNNGEADFPIFIICLFFFLLFMKQLLRAATLTQTGLLLILFCVGCENPRSTAFQRVHRCQLISVQVINYILVHIGTAECVGARINQISPFKTNPARRQIINFV